MTFSVRDRHPFIQVAETFQRPPWHARRASGAWRGSPRSCLSLGVNPDEEEAKAQAEHAAAVRALAEGGAGTAKVIPLAPRRRRPAWIAPIAASIAAAAAVEGPVVLAWLEPLALVGPGAD